MVRMANLEFRRARVEYEVPSRAAIGFQASSSRRRGAVGLLHTEFLGGGRGPSR